MGVPVAAAAGTGSAVACTGNDAAAALLPAGGGSRLGPDWSAEEVTHLGEELSDVLMYTIKLADTCGVDLPAVVARKMRLNELKYPVAGGEAEKTADS
ncbi:hypothetical protein MMPV_009745 [Pyropia vietnamensis]